MGHEKCMAPFRHFFFQKWERMEKNIEKGREREREKTCKQQHANVNKKSFYSKGKGDHPTRDAVK